MPIHGLVRKRKRERAMIVCQLIYARIVRLVVIHIDTSRSSRIRKRRRVDYVFKQKKKIRRLF